MKLGAKQTELEQLMQKFVPRSRIGIFGSERTRSTHWTVNSCFGAFCSVWMHFGWFHYFMKLSAKRAELEQLMQKFVPRSRIRIFCSEPTRSTPLDPKLMFWCVLKCLDAFWVVLLLHKTRCKVGCNGSINAQVRGMKSHWNFWQRTHPIQPIGP